MASCKDCIHYSVCGYVEFQDLECKQFKPTADVVEVKHGKWDYIATHDCFSCNICKFDSDVAMKYCGGCGAKMDLSEKLTGCERRDT